MQKFKYDVKQRATVMEPIFTGTHTCWTNSVKKKTHTEFHENPQNGLVTDGSSQADGTHAATRFSHTALLSFVKKKNLNFFAKSAYLIKNSQPVQNGCHANPGVTHSLTQTKSCITYWTSLQGCQYTKY
jgi:hypothetical protein